MIEPDWYDDAEVERFRDHRSDKLMDIYRRWHRANEKGNKESASKAIKAVLKHKEADEKYKAKAERYGCYWW